MPRALALALALALGPHLHISLQCLSLLLQSGAAIDLKSVAGFTPLCYAAEEVNRCLDLAS